MRIPVSHPRKRNLILGVVTGIVATAAAWSAAASVRLEAGDHLLAGDRPGWRIAGLEPGSEVLVETYQTAPEAVAKDGAWSTIHPMFHAKARFWADGQGNVDLDNAAPIDGTYSGSDPRGLLWSGEVVGGPREEVPPPDVAVLLPTKDGHVRIIIRVAGKVAATRLVAIDPCAAGVQLTRVDTPSLIGVFAAPAGARKAPTVILLHGSEGGTFESAAAVAGRYASRGFAAFALIYFSWPYEHVPNAPQAFSLLPVERVDAARTFLAARAEVDPRRIALVGGSKGAEYALLASTVYPWVKAVVACVPSSLVWGGFGAPAGAHGESFTLAGKPVPFVPYGDYGPVERHEISSAERHRRDREASPLASTEAAMIPVERSDAHFLLISGGRDAVWPSDAMSAELMARLSARNAGPTAEWLSFPDSGHYLCGTGISPVRFGEANESDLGSGLIDHSQKMTVAAMQMADMKVCAHRS